MTESNEVSLEKKAREKAEQTIEWVSGDIYFKKERTARLASILVEFAREAADEAFRSDENLGKISAVITKIAADKAKSEGYRKGLLMAAEISEGEGMSEPYYPECLPEDIAALIKAEAEKKKQDE